METLFTLDNTQVTDPAITHWRAQQPIEIATLAFNCFNVMKSLGSDVSEILHDGAPTACVGKYPFAYVNACKAHVNVGFFYGAFLLDQDSLLEGSGKRMRHVKLKPGEILYEQPVYGLIFQAYADIKHRIYIAENNIPGR